MADSARGYHLTLVNREELLFKTDIVRSELRSRSVRSSAVTVAFRGTQMLVFLGSAMILARVLSPSDFGVQAMVLPASFLANNLANHSLQSAVIHRESLDSADASALFRYVLRVGLVVAAVMAVLAPFMARLYHEPRVTGIAIVWAATIFAATFSAIQEALLKRQLLFGVIMKAHMAALIVSVLVAVGAALLGMGYWSLMLQVAVMELTRVVIIWIVCPWRPSLGSAPTTRDAVLAVRRYWMGLSASRAVSWIGDHLDRVIVGSVGGALAAGLYDSAKRWASFAFQELHMSLADVAVGSLSRVRDERERYRVYLRNVFLPILSLSLPVMGFMFVDARRVLHILLGDQWLAADGFVRMMCIATVGAAGGKLMQWVYMSLGQTDRQLRWTFVTTPLNVLAVLLGAQRGAYGVAVAVAIVNVALAVPSLWYGLRVSPVALRECLTIFLRPLSAAVMAALALWAADPHLPRMRPDLVALGLRGLLFGLVYATAWIALPGGVRAWRNIVAGMSELRIGRSRESAPSAALAESIT
ncbi:MAG TPA: oligosaccharide flippase family protein [Gemmatimonadaceae bacterium]